MLARRRPPVNEHVAPTTPVMIDVAFLVEPLVPPVLVEHVALSVSCATPAPVTGYVAPALVIEHIAPQPSVTCVPPSQQLAPDYTMTTATTGISFDTTSFVNPQFPITVVEAAASQVIGSPFPLDEVAVPMYS